MGASPSRLYTIDALRGIAALGVCWLHYTYDNDAFLPVGFLRSSGAWGWLGVEIFFVISGFVIPYSLHRGGYHVMDYGRYFLNSTFRWSDYGTFILKRLIRLEPPYLAAIFIGIALQYATPHFVVAPVHYLIVQILLHVGYANTIFGYPYLNGVFWTLGIEMQYYLLVGLLFPIIAYRSLIVRICCFGCLAWLAFTIAEFVFVWLFLFMLGMAAFQFRAGIYGRWQFLMWIAVLGFGAWQLQGGAIAGTGIITALLLGLVQVRARNPLLFFGSISYSLYLLHAPIGSLVFSLGMPMVHTMAGRTVVVVAALAISIFAAWLLYRFVECPAQEWSSRIRYRRKQTVALEAATPTRTSIEPTPL